MNLHDDQAWNNANPASDRLPACCCVTNKRKPCPIPADRKHDGKSYCHVHDPFGTNQANIQQRKANRDAERSAESWNPPIEKAFAAGVSSILAPDDEAPPWNEPVVEAVKKFEAKKQDAFDTRCRNLLADAQNLARAMDNDNIPDEDFAGPVTARHHDGLVTLSSKTGRSISMTEETFERIGPAMTKRGRFSDLPPAPNYGRGHIDEHFPDITVTMATPEWAAPSSQTATHCSKATDR